ncbi:hypothetical protein MMC06_003274, partial [Schaereria dolodes]|nr:hypothetical protein [Schaereria dolodes]
MLQDDDAPPKEELSNNSPQAKSAKSQWFTTPKPIKRLFDRFPLQTLPANQLPHRAAPSREQNVLYIFTTADSAENGEPSFNPSCLKWQ